MTDHNARQAGLTEVERGTLQAAIENLRGGATDPEARFRIASNIERILAAHSADARNGEGVVLTEGDEREKFESVFCGLDFTSHTNGEYLNPYVEHMWEGWHRRAQQSATPAEPERFWQSHDDGLVSRVEATPPECTCPSGNGSLRHPCPVHAAQEGGQ